jgi:RimJ/RimL family protein N-acetyltransferase
MSEIYIEDERILLAEFTEHDCELAYRSWLEDDVVAAYNFRLNRTFPEYLEFSRNAPWGAAIRDKASGTSVGRIGISPGTYPDLTITIYKDYRGLGYGTAACKLAIRYAFEHLKLDRLYAGCYEDNAASYQMLVKSEFRRHPEGDETEPHILTGFDRLQYDFIIEAENRRE